MSLECLARFGFDLPEQITVHLDAGYDSAKTRDLLDELGCDHVISVSGMPLQAGRRWPIERTNSWHNNFGKLRRMTERRAGVALAWVRLANAVIVVRRLMSEAWPRYRWDSRPRKRTREWR